MSNQIVKTKDGKIRLQVIVECDWPDVDYEDVHPEMILEDALSNLDAKDGVRIYLNPDMYKNPSD